MFGSTMTLVMYNIIYDITIKKINSWFIMLRMLIFMYVEDKDETKYTKGINLVKQF